jgi:hypothetical protein
MNVHQFLRFLPLYWMPLFFPGRFCIHHLLNESPSSESHAGGFVDHVLQLVDSFCPLLSGLQS